MGLKRGILPAAILWGLAGLLEAIPVTIAELNVAPPHFSKGGSTSLETYLKDMPFHALYEVVKEPRGSTMVRIKSHSNFAVSFSRAADAIKPGRQVVKLRGRAFSAVAKLNLKVKITGAHPWNDSCSGGLSETLFDCCVEAALPVGNTVGEVEIPFDIPDPLLCPHCHRPFLYDLAIYLELAESPGIKDWRDLGVEFGDIRLETSFPLRQIKTIGASAQLLKLDREATAKITDWRNKHRQAFKSFPRRNEFNAAGFKDWCNPEKPRKSLDNYYYYWTEAELREINPGFEIKKLCSLPFFEADAYPEAEFDYFSAPRLYGMEFSGIFYAFDGHGSIIRIDPVSGAREYVRDKSIWEKRLNRTQTFSDNTHQAVELSGKFYRLSDGSVVDFPANIKLKDSAYYTVTPNHAFWIGKDGKTIFRGNPDFSAPEPLQLKLPELNSQITPTTFDGIYSYDDDSAILLRMEATSKRQPRLEIWLELEPESGLCHLKMPVFIGECFINPIEPHKEWIYFYRGTILVNPGSGHMFAPIRCDKPEWKTLFPPSPLKLDDVPLDVIKQAFRFGGYLCTSVAQPNRIIFYNMVRPEESLMLYGFSGGFQSSPNRGALRFSNFDGLYEIRPLKPAVLPDALPPPEKPSSDLRLSEVITAIEPEEPALFDAKIVKNKQGKEQLVFSTKPVATESNLMLKLKLPPLPNRKKYYYLHFDRPWKGVSFQSQNADGSGNPEIQSGNVQLIPPETTQIKIMLFPGHPEETVTLLAISPESEYYD